MCLAADEQDGNGLQFENFTLNFSSCFRAIQESIFYFLFEDVFFLSFFRYCFAWVIVTTTNFRIVWTNFSLHENLALITFDSHQKCNKVGLLSLAGESKAMEHF